VVAAGGLTGQHYAEQLKQLLIGLLQYVGVLLLLLLTPTG
jgi:hypothetical protein